MKLFFNPPTFQGDPNLGRKRQKKRQLLQAASKP